MHGNEVSRRGEGNRPFLGPFDYEIIMLNWRKKGVGTPARPGCSCHFRESKNASDQGHLLKLEINPDHQRK